MADFKMVRLPNELVARVDAARGLVPREAWVRRALERELKAPELMAARPVEAQRVEAEAEAVVPSRPLPKIAKRHWA